MRPRQGSRAAPSKSPRTSGASSHRNTTCPIDIAETVFESRVGGRLYDRGIDGSECPGRACLPMSRQTASSSAGDRGAGRTLRSSPAAVDAREALVRALLDAVLHRRVPLPGRLEADRLRQLRLLTEIFELKRLQVVLEGLHEARRAARPRGTRPPRGRTPSGTDRPRRGGRPSPRRRCRRPTIRGSARDRSRRKRRARAVRRRPARRGSRARSGCDGGFVHRQLTACSRSFAILASSFLVSFVNAKATGHIEPSSRFATSLKPSIA